jgi:outer membrane protein TolC
MSKKLLLLPVLFICVFAGRLHAQESFVPDISYPYLQKLIDTAKKYYVPVRMKAAQTNIALTAYHQAQTSWFDVITPYYVYNPQRSIYLLNGYQVSLSLNLGTLIAKPFIIHNARQAVKIAQLDESMLNNTIEAMVKRLYFAYIEAKANLRVLTKAVLDAQSNAEQLKYKYEKVEITLAEYSNAQALVYSQNSNKLMGELSFFNAKVGLEEVVGKRLEDIK